MNILNNKISATLINSQLRMFIFGVNAIVYSKYLGIDAYGELAYILGIASSLVYILDLGLANLFIARLFKRQDSSSLLNIFFFIVGFVSLILVLLLIVSNLFIGELMPRLDLLIISVFSLFLQSTGFSLANSYVESTGRSVSFMYKAAVTVVLFGITTLSLTFTNLISLEIIVGATFIFNTIIFFFAFNYNSLRFKKHRAYEFRRVIISSRYMVLFSLISFLFVFVDRQVIQLYGGNLSQASYFLGLQIAVIMLSPISAMGKIIWSSFSKKLKNDISQIKSEIDNKSRIILFINTSAVLVGILVIKPLMLMYYGDIVGFDAVVIMVAMTSTLHQSFGQTLSMYCLSLNMQRQYMMIGAVTIMINVSLSLLYSSNFGISVELYLMIKNMFVQIVSVEVLRLFLEKKLQIKTSKKEYFYAYCVVLFTILMVNT